MRLLAIVMCVVLAGCASTQPEPQELFEQLPNWDGAAHKTCCGHLRTCQPWQTPRC